MVHQEIAWHRSLSAALLRSGLGLMAIVGLIVVTVPKGEAIRFLAWAVIGCVLLEDCGWIGICLCRIAQLFVSPPYFYSRSARLVPWFGWICFVLILLGLLWWPGSRTPRLSARRRLPYYIRPCPCRLAVPVCVCGDGQSGSHWPDLEDQDGRGPGCQLRSHWCGVYHFGLGYWIPVG